MKEVVIELYTPKRANDFQQKRYVIANGRAKLSIEELASGIYIYIQLDNPYYLKNYIKN
jgi:hypothetical protein